MLIPPGAQSSLLHSKGNQHWIQLKTQVDSESPSSLLSLSSAQCSLVFDLHTHLQQTHTALHQMAQLGERILCLQLANSGLCLAAIAFDLRAVVHGQLCKQTRN